MISTNDNNSTRINTIQILLLLTENYSKILEQFEQNYIDLLISEKEKSVQKHLNQLLFSLNPNEYSEDYDATIKKLTSGEKILKIIPSYEFENDFIRYKIKIANNTENIIWDVRYQISKFEKNFILHSISPKLYQIFEKYTVVLNVIQPGDIKEIFALLEPKSSQIYLEGTLHYKNYDEKDFLNLKAPNIVVDLLDRLPKLKEKSEKVSIIHCREFFDFHAKCKSLNAFSLPKSIMPEAVYSIGKKILEDLSFVQIIEIVDNEIFFGESTYFAEVQPIHGDLTKENEIVIILRASNENYAMEINIGCNINSYLVAIQVKFDKDLRELIYNTGNLNEGERLIELRCPECLQSYDKLRTWCPWCGTEISSLE